MTEQEERYAELMGQEALERQKKLARERCGWCGAKLPNHHQLCKSKRRLRDEIEVWPWEA